MRPQNISNNPVADFFRGFVDAGRGLARLIRSERNARLHLLATVAVVAASFLTGRDRQQWIGILIAIGLVWTAEALNTAVETLADRITQDQDPMIAAAKDMAAGGVLAAAIVAGFVGLFAFELI